MIVVRYMTCLGRASHHGQPAAPGVPAATQLTLTATGCPASPTLATVVTLASVSVREAHQGATASRFLTGLPRSANRASGTGRDTPVEGRGSGVGTPSNSP